MGAPSLQHSQSAKELYFNYSDLQRSSALSGALGSFTEMLFGQVMDSSFMILLSKLMTEFLLETLKLSHEWLGHSR